MKSYEELQKLTSDIPANYHDGTFEMLYKYLPQCPAGEYLDFGTGLAKSVCFTALLRPDLKITTFDNAVPYNFPDYNEQIERTLQSHGVTGVTHFVGDSMRVELPQLFEGMYIDSGHSYDLTLAELIRWVPRVKVGGIIILDDYLDDRVEVKKAADDYVKANTDKVKVLEDTKMGFVMQRI